MAFGNVTLGATPSATLGGIRSGMKSPVTFVGVTSGVTVFVGEGSGNCGCAQSALDVAPLVAATCTALVPLRGALS